MIERHSPRKVVALTDGDVASLEISASGGAFAVLAREVLRRGGVVFGAALAEDGSVRHVSVESIDELHRLQGSKYAQGHVGGTFAECIKVLGQGREVLYSGLPCQIHGLRARVESSGLEYEQKERLLTCDLICHGTPSRKLFAAYLDWLADRHGADDGIHGFRFRTKEFGWGLYYYYYYYYRDGVLHEVSGGAGDDPYYHAFSRGVIYRKGCYKCPFCTTERVGDITIGDFWGVRKRMPGAYDPRGVSAVLLNTPKAVRFFEDRIADSGVCSWSDVRLDDVVAEQVNLRHPTRRSTEDERVAARIERALEAGDYGEVFERLLPVDQGRNAKIRRALPKSVLRLLYGLRNGR